MTEKLTRKIGELLVAKKMSLSVAESCTGGLIASAITEIEGASRYFRGGIIAYDNEIKGNLLCVPRDILSSLGAVSSETVEAMALGVCKMFKTDYAISISGIAGPGGGTELKPVGLIYIGIAFRQETKSYKYLFKGSRRDIRESAVNTALKHLLEQLQSEA